MGVFGIQQENEAFVWPFSESDSGEVHLLLGIPLLHSVNAKIQIRKSIIEIGDKFRGEKMEITQGPKLA